MHPFILSIFLDTDNEDMEEILRGDDTLHLKGDSGLNSPVEEALKSFVDMDKEAVTNAECATAKCNKTQKARCCCLWPNILNKPLSAAKLYGDNQPPAVSLKLTVHLGQKRTTGRSPANSSDQQNKKTRSKWNAFTQVHQVHFTISS